MIRIITGTIQEKAFLKPIIKGYTWWLTRVIALINLEAIINVLNYYLNLLNRLIVHISKSPLPSLYFRGITNLIIVYY